MKDRLCPGTTPYSQSIRVPRCQRWTLNAYQKSALCALVGIAHFCKFTTICIGCQDVRVSLFSQSFSPNLERSQDKSLRKDCPPNQEVKPSSDDGTWGETSWESSSSPVRNH